MGHSFCMNHSLLSSAWETVILSLSISINPTCLSSYLHDLTTGKIRCLEALSKAQHWFSTNLSYHFLDTQWLGDPFLSVVTAPVHVFAWLV